MSKARSSGKKKNSDTTRMSEKMLALARDPSFQKKVGITVGVVALGTYLMSRGSGRSRNQSATETRTKEIYRGPPPLSKEEVDTLYAAAIESLQRKSNERSTPMGDEDDDGITPEFRTFYQKIERSAPPSQYPPELRCTIAEFLIVHARFENISRQSASAAGPPPPLSAEQANKIRSWVAFESVYDSAQLSIIANKIDILYRVGMAQKSVSDLKSLHTWLKSDFPVLTESSHTTDDNFFAIYVQHRFLLACIFGFWDEAQTYVVPLDNIILPRSRMKLRQSFTQRAMSRPHAQCNFNEIATKLDVISQKYLLELRPPVRFEMWRIELFKLKKIEEGAGNAGVGEEEKGNGIGADRVANDWQYFVAGRNLGSNRGNEAVVKQVYVFGSCLQLISPIQGVSGNLPVTGVWNDSEMSVGMAWTFNATPPSQVDRMSGMMNALLVRKEIVMNLERIGHSSNEEIGREFVDECDGTGWVWRGKMVVDTKQGRRDVATESFNFEPINHNEYEAVLVVHSRD